LKPVFNDYHKENQTVKKYAPELKKIVFNNSGFKYSSMVSTKK
jgi:hypothetical protein